MYIPDGVGVMWWFACLSSVSRNDYREMNMIGCSKFFFGLDSLFI